MAELTPAANEDPLKALGKAALSYIQDSRTHKTDFEKDFKEGYFFAAPHRARAMHSEAPKNTPTEDEALCDTSFAVELSEDFVTLILNTFMPEHEQWAKREPGMDIPGVAREKALADIEESDTAIFKAISASNFHAECAKGFMPDLAVGTVAMWIEDKGVWAPLHCQAVPIHELEICLGPDGSVDFRAVVSHVKMKHVKQHLPKIALPKEVEDRIGRQPNGKTVIRRCFWRDWSETTKIVWQYVAMVGDKAVHAARLEGPGSCPLIVGRFGPCPEWSWGRGPLLKSLPDLRQYEALVRDRTDHSELSLRPPVGVPDDSFTNFEGGIEPGMAYAIRPGTGGDIKKIYDPPPVNAAVYDQQDREVRLKRMFYLDWPEQRGKTPPSASQWLDQVTESLRRIGTPGIPFWKEFAAEVFNRFAWLLEKRRTIEPVMVDGKMIPLIAYNPALRAIEQNEVAAFARFAEIGGQAFPEEWKIKTDGGLTLETLARKIGANKIWVQRKAEDVQNAVDLMAPLLGGATPGAPMVGGAPMPDPAGGAVSAPIENRNYITGRS